MIMFEASLNTVDDFLFYVAHLDEFGKKATYSISNSIELGEHRLPAMFKHFSFSCFFSDFFSLYSVHICDLDMQRAELGQYVGDFILVLLRFSRQIH